MKLTFSEHGWDDYVYWQTEDRKTLKKINGLINEARRDPFEGTGKPEPLKGDLAGLWSRRIDEKNRLVYEPTADSLIVHQCRYHYSK
ncbi:Txe/YoeB family addiction module toxin [Streptomyces sp. IMTB 1903]|uniref:Txe/YoeB family addiction module toxin n=1 Tax=Streptomyces sp. IMTB 1903 TaxID=1776680 RepID=UPI00075C0E07|nr:Txe/YoeB family addiction module toxin [Streptomyces sp. IMTB 1903]